MSLPENFNAHTWDEQQARLNGHFLQSSPWARFQDALGRQVVTGQGSGFAWLGVVMHGRGVDYLYVPCGPTVAAGLEPALASLRRAGQELKLDFVRCEPRGKVTATQLRRWEAKSAAAVQPQHTLILDLIQPEADLRHGLASGHRNGINAAERKGITTRKTTDTGEIEAFIALMHDTSARGGFKAHPDDYFRQLAHTLLPTGAAKLFFAEADGRTVAGALVYDWNGTRYYAHAAADQRLNRELGAAVVLLWAIITDAREQGDLANLDFFGIAPNDDPKHPWHGLTKFKRGFGGQPASTVGAWEIPLKPLKYRAYRLAKRVKR